MRKIANLIVKFRYVLIFIFLGLSIISIFLMSKVNINYDMTNYLDKDQTSATSLKIMQKEFGSVGQCQYMVCGDKDEFTFDVAKLLGDKIQEDKGVASVVFAENDTDDNYFKEENGKNYALYKLFLTTGNYETESYDTLDRIDKIIDDFTVELNTYSNGAAVENDFLTNALDKDMIIIISVVALVVLLILTLVSKSWFEPIIFAIIVFGSILINLGSNIILNHISYINDSMSFITKSIAAVMQLALSMDYAIVLLHTYKEMKETTNDKKEAMSLAIAKSFAPVSASSLTTIAGLVALMFMSFSIGFDVGLVLAKGILISLLCVFLFMPALLLIFDTLIVKTSHRSIDEVLYQLNDKHVEKKKQNGKKVFTFTDFQIKTKIIIPVIALILIIIGCIYNYKTEYSFTLEASTDKNATVNVDNEKITDEFGLQNTLVVLIPKDKYSYSEEMKIINYMESYKYKDETIVNSSQGLTTYGVNIPLTSEMFSNEFGISKDILDDVYNMMNLYDSENVINNDGVLYITPENLINFVVNNKAAITYANSKQQELETTYNSFKDDLYDSDGNVKLAVVSAMSTYCSGFEKYLELKEENPAAAQLILESLGEETEEAAALKYQQYKALVSIVNNEYVTNKYSFISNEIYSLIASQSVLNNDEATKGNVYAFELIKFLATYEYPIDELGNKAKLLEIYGMKLQEEISNKQILVNTAYKSLKSDNYYRIIFNLNMEISSDKAFEIIDEITDELYDGEFKDLNLKVVCESFVYSQIKKVFNRDIVVVNLISFFAILLIIAFTFKSYFVPVLLTALIQGAIWITMGTTAMYGSQVFFVCYIVVMCVQMGATIDYAILLTTNYTRNRKTMNVRKSMEHSMKSSLLTIITSSSILIISTFIIGKVSRVKIISDLGLLLTKGCIFSVLVVLICLPQFLILCDKLIEKTSYKTKFYHESDDNLDNDNLGLNENNNIENENNVSLQNEDCINNIDENNDEK